MERKMSNACSDFDFNLAEHLLNSISHDNAVVFHYEGQDIVRKELVSLVTTMCYHMQEIGVTESDRVLLLLHDSPAFIATFLACVYLGAIPVPLNPRTSQNGLRHVTHDSRARFAVIEVDAVETLVPVLCESPYLQKDGIVLQDYYHDDGLQINAVLRDAHLHSLNRWLMHGTGRAPEKPCVKKPQSIAFWQYSSGTTGLPKAVQHTQIGMLDNTELFAKNTLRIGPCDKLYSIPKMFFGYGLGNSFFFPILCKSQALIDSKWPTPERVISNIRKYKPTVFFGVPAIYSLLLDEKWGLTQDDISSVRLWFSAGTPLPEQLFERWNKRFGSVILDGIGATEAGHVFLTNSMMNYEPGSTGYPVQGYGIRLINDKGEEAGDGEQGVLMVKGPSISPGYWENPILNQQKFKDGWYRTGDVFVREAAGNYRCSGREDDLFKVKGRWVIPFEIETMVHRQFPVVKEAVMIGRTDSDGMTVPVLFVSTHASVSDKLTTDIVEFLKSKIDSYKLPQACFAISEFPRNDNGKLLRSKLIEMSQAET